MLSLDRFRRVYELWLSTVEIFQIAQGRVEICLRISRGGGYRVRSEEAVGKPVGTPDDAQLIRSPEWSIGPLIAIALAYGRIYRH